MNSSLSTTVPGRGFMEVGVEAAGLYFPALLIIVLAALFLAWGVEYFLERFGWTDFIWNVPVFFIALTTWFASLLGLWLLP